MAIPARTTRRPRRYRRARLCRRQRLNGRNGAKHSKRDKAREREEIERSWDVPGKSATPNLDAGPSYAPTILGRPSPQPQAHLAVGGARGSAAGSPSPHSPSGAVSSSVKPSQPNNSNSAPTVVKNPESSSSTGGPSTAPPSSNNKSKAKAKSVPNGPNGKAPTPSTTQAQTNGAATLVKSAASAAIVEAVHAHPNGNGSLPPTDRNKFMREVLALIHVRAFFSSFHFVAFHSFRVVRFDRLTTRSWIGFGRSIVRGRRVSSLPCVLIAVAYCLYPSSPLSSPLPSSRARCVAPRYQCPCICRAMYSPALTCIDVRCRVPVGVRACLERTFEPPGVNE